jgi:hypothetical protein
MSALTESKLTNLAPVPEQKRPLLSALSVKGERNTVNGVSVSVTNALPLHATSFDLPEKFANLVDNACGQSREEETSKPPPLPVRTETEHKATQGDNMLSSPLQGARSQECGEEGCSVQCGRSMNKSQVDVSTIVLQSRKNAASSTLLPTHVEAYPENKGGQLEPMDVVPVHLFFYDHRCVPGLQEGALHCNKCSGKLKLKEVRGGVTRGRRVEGLHYTGWFFPTTYSCKKCKKNISGSNRKVLSSIGFPLSTLESMPVFMYEMIGYTRVLHSLIHSYSPHHKNLTGLLHIISTSRTSQYVSHLTTYTLRQKELADKRNAARRLGGQ